MIFVYIKSDLFILWFDQFYIIIYLLYSIINYTHPQFFFNKEFFPKYNFEKIPSNNEVKKNKRFQ